MKRWTPVLVKWQDAHGGDTGWGRLNKTHTTPESITTVGMLFSENVNGVTVALSRTSRKHVDCYIFIPRSGIESIEELSC